MGSNDELCWKNKLTGKYTRNTGFECGGGWEKTHDDNAFFFEIKVETRMDVNVFFFK